MTGKVGRNDPCPCGSGRKYKKCCQAGFDEKDFHYRRLRLPVPALNNMTPREAAKTEEGRELLESLLLDYERHDDAENENLMRPDIPELRRKLGMHV
jgi:hypothetical protein